MVNNVLNFGNFQIVTGHESDFQKMSFKSRFSEIMLPLFLSLCKGEMKRGFMDYQGIISENYINPHPA